MRKAANPRGRGDFADTDATPREDVEIVFQVAGVDKKVTHLF